MIRPLAAAVIVTVSAVAASAWWLHRDEPHVVEPAPPAATKVAPENLSRNVESPPAAPEAPLAEVPEWDPELVKRVEHKYRFLFAELRLTPGQLAQLRELLLEQQRLRDMLGPADDPDLKQDPAERARLERALAAIDARVRALIDTAQYARYETLRESDVEQGHLREFSGGVSALAPLTQQQERLILDARLRHKQRFESGLREIGLERASLSKEERLYAHRNVAQALHEYRDNFLTEVRPALTEDQYFLLSSYETTEFARELERLQVLINSK